MLNIQGKYVFDSSPQQVWPYIFDPEELIGLVPGCNQLEQVSPYEYRGKLIVGIASISGAYDTYIHVEEIDPFVSCRFSGEVTGPTGIIKGEASFHLKEVKNKTEIEYLANAILTGALAKLNPRFVNGVVSTLINQGMSKLNNRLVEENDQLLQKQ